MTAKISHFETHVVLQFRTLWNSWERVNLQYVQQALGGLNKAPVCPHDNSRLPHEYAIPPRMIAHNAANVIVVFNSEGIEKFQSVLTEQDVRGINMSISDIGPKTFVAVRSDKTGTIQVLHRVETQHAIMASVVHNRTGESSNKRLTKWNSQCYVVRCIHGIRTADEIRATYMVEGAADGLARAEKFMELTGQEFEPVTSANRHLPAEAMFGMPLGSNWNSDYAVTECTSDSQFQLVDYEDYEMFYQNVDHSFIHRLGRQDLVVATINVEENYTKSHFDESVDLLIRHYSDVLTYRVDVIVARVGKLATDLGEVGRRTNGRQRADARSCIATTILESMINQVKAKAPHKSEECLTLMVFGNADPYAVMAALAASKGPYTFPQDIDPSVSRDTLTVCYLDWKKAEITASIPSNLSEKSEDSGFNHLSFVHTAHHDSSQNWLDIRTIGQVGNRAHHLQNSDLLFKSMDTTWKTPLIIHLKHTEQKSYRTTSDEANKKRKQGRKDYMASKASSSGSAFRATAAASLFGSARAMGTAITVKDYILSPWVQLLLIAVIAAAILIMMPPTRRGHGRGSGDGQQGQPDAKAKAAPPKAKSSVTIYRPLEDPFAGIDQPYRAERGLIPSDGWGHIQYIEGRDVYYDQYNCNERQQITSMSTHKRRCRRCYEIAKSHGAGLYVPPPPLPEGVATRATPAKILASPKLQGPPPKVSSIAQPAEIPLTLGEQVRAKGLAVLTAIDPETEPEPSSSSVQAAIAQGQHNTDRMLAKLHACRNYSAPAGTRVPPGNLQDNPDYKGAYTALFELPERFGVDMATVSAISQGLIVSYEAVSFYEKALLRVEQQLFEQTETQARLHEEMYKNDELSSIVQAQDEHKLRLEEAHINAENAHRVFEEDMIRRLQEAEEANREISSNLEKEKQEKASISRLLENRDNQMSSEISDLTISRQEALLQYEFAGTQHSDDIRAIRQDNQRLREQLLEAYRMRDDYHQLVNELSSHQPADREVHMAEYITVKNKLWSAESELNRVVQKLEQSQESRRGIRQNLAQLQERYIALDREKKRTHTAASIPSRCYPSSQGTP